MSQSKTKEQIRESVKPQLPVISSENKSSDSVLINDSSILDSSFRENDTKTISYMEKDIKDKLQNLIPITEYCNNHKVVISDSKNVHIGNITNINGNIKLRDTRSTRLSSKTTEERNNQNEVLAIIPRNSWHAKQPVTAYDLLLKPINYVVILHTATKSSDQKHTNLEIIRIVQNFHMESRGWDDISYNFLIGCDGNAYEGRGWNAVGAHTIGYNKKSIGIAFVGNFMRVLPSKSAITTCKTLLQKGVEEGHLVPNFKLICHCQCTSTESPGRRLFEEIQTWDNFYNLEIEDRPIHT